MIHAQDFLRECQELGFRFFTGTPCSYLKPFINSVINSQDQNLRYIPANNEGDAVALAAGAYLGNEMPVVMFQNSGLGNAVNTITSLNYIFHIPFLGITTLRGEVGGDPDEPQHALMGKITQSLLDLMEVPWEFFPTKKEDIIPALKRAHSYIKEYSKPYFFVMKKNSVEECELQTKGLTYAPDLLTRTQALQVIKNYTPKNTAYIATTGKTNREFYELGDEEKNLYMVGSMGQALSMGIGLALNSSRPTCVIDGDGALMMRMGNMTMVGILRPKNLLHILLDNNQHDSTGGQETHSNCIAFEEIAKACHYDESYVVRNENEFVEVMKKITPELEKKSCFIRFFLRPGSPKTLGRPKVGPKEVALRFKNYVNNSGISK